MVNCIVTNMSIEEAWKFSKKLMEELSIQPRPSIRVQYEACDTWWSQGLTLPTFLLEYMKRPKESHQLTTKHFEEHWRPIKKGAFVAISKDEDLLGCFHSYSGDDGRSKSDLVCFLCCFNSLLLDLEKASSCVIIHTWNKVCGSNICCVWSYMAKKSSEKN